MHVLQCIERGDPLGRAFMSALNQVEFNGRHQMLTNGSIFHSDGKIGLWGNHSDFDGPTQGGHRPLQPFGLGSKLLDPRSHWPGPLQRRPRFAEMEQRVRGGEQSKEQRHHYHVFTYGSVVPSDASTIEAMFTVGCVPYANAIPLVAMFERLGDRSPVRVVYDVPSRLPERLDSGECDAILVSSVDALRVPGRRMADYVCIGSDGPVKSVRLFSNVPANHIETLALDASSLTSNRLAQIILNDWVGIKPRTITMAPNLDEMLAEADACVLIGDIGMLTERPQLQVLDLGEEWRKLTGMPFVWAGWIGNERLTPELAMLLSTAASVTHAGKDPRPSWLDRFILRRWFAEMDTLTATRFEQLLDFAVERSGWDREMLRDYYKHTIVYELTQNMLGGMKEFQRRLIDNGFTDCVHFPAIVSGLGANMEAFSNEYSLTEIMP